MTNYKQMNEDLAREATELGIDQQQLVQLKILAALQKAVAQRENTFNAWREKSRRAEERIGTVLDSVEKEIEMLKAHDEEQE